MKKQPTKQQAKQDQEVAQKDRQLLSIDQAASYLSVSRSTINRLMRDHELPVVRVGTDPRIKLAALNAWIDEHEEKAV